MSPGGADPDAALVERLRAGEQSAFAELVTRYSGAVIDACRDYVEQFEQTIALTGRVEAEGLPPGMQDELLSAFRAWRGEQL